MVLSGFDVKKEFAFIDVNAPIFCFTNNSLVGHATKMLMEYKPDHVKKEIIPD